MVGQHFFNTLAGFASPTSGLQFQAEKLPAPIPLTSYNSSNPISMFNATQTQFETTENISSSSLLTMLLSLAIKNMDLFKLMLIGGIIETSRRLVFAFWSQLWAWLSSSCCITVQFDSNDDVYHWMMLWLGNQSIWDSSRKMCITSARSQPGTAEYTLGTRNPKPFSDQQLKYLPTYESTSWFNYKGTRISVTRHKSERSSTITAPAETLILCWRHDRLREILKEAKDLSRSKDVVNIYSAGTYEQWSRTSSRRKRHLRSVILEPEVKNGILSDAFDFLLNEEWYIDRGIPYRRGYLLHGVPGSGKTSLIHSIAGELGLDVYIVSLSKPGLDDSKLNQLFCAMPPRSILLIEDIDAVFRKVSTVRKAIAGASTPDSNQEKDKENEPLGNVSLSGLLNALDGIAASEGRLLFATTNCVTALDEALCRPGRMDVHVEFKNATKWQARELFWSFFEPRNRGEKEKNTEKGEATASTGTSTAPIRFSPAPEPVSSDELAQLSDQFAESVPVDVFSVASLQGYLMLYKERPRSALKDIKTWIEDNLQKKRMKKEKMDGQ